MTTNTVTWNDRPYFSTECACGYRSNWTPSAADNDRKAAAHGKKCAKAAS